MLHSGGKNWILNIFFPVVRLEFLLSYAHVGLRLYFLGFLFAGMNIMLVAYFSAVDRPRPAIVGSLMRGMIAIVFASLFGLNGVWLSFLGSEVITFAVILVLGRKQ